MNTLTALMQSGRESVVLQTPYIICNRAMYDALETAAGGTAQVRILTNAPQSGANPWGCADYLNQKRPFCKPAYGSANGAEKTPCTQSPS